MASARPFVDFKLKQRKVVLFSKTYSPECSTAKDILDQYNLSDVEYQVVEIEKRQDCVQIENYLLALCLTDSRKVPLLFVEGRYIGSEQEISLLHSSSELKQVLKGLDVFKDDQSKI
ncbi:unnamed protein product [Candidula unifasciata]|uniref:Glutaredoxin domain-containing protein n=1 Tax=Candidula unifasciata TaxID=100452 RepID=A0A8S3ZEM5_9EUPU|nr:unnamed protein product [Candidula unifasciata]